MISVIWLFGLDKLVRPTSLSVCGEIFLWLGFLFVGVSHAIHGAESLRT